MSASAPITFNGTSTYANDLQQVLTRAVAIATLPLTQLNTNLTLLQSRSTAIDGLNTNFAAIQTAVNNLNAGVTSTSATVSNATVASAQAGSTTLPGTYTLNVIDPGSQTSELSKNGLITVADPSTQSISSASTLTLTVNGTTYNLTPSSNSLNSLASAINGSGAGLMATIVNVGPPTAPDYRLAVQTQALGPSTVQINDGTQDLLDVLVTGTPAQYQVNGQPSTPISSNSSTITVAPGLTANLLAAGTTNILVSQTASALSDALSSFVTAYNAAVDALNQQRGSAGGALAGDSIISTLTQSLRDLNGYAGSSGAVQSLADLGINLDQTGHMSLDQGVLSTVMAQHPTDVTAFLGSATTTGFLATASSVLTSLEDPNNGTFQSLSTEAQAEITKENQQISDTQDRINLMQTDLTARLSAADAAIAAMQAQVSYFTTLFSTMSDNAYTIAKNG